MARRRCKSLDSYGKECSIVLFHTIVWLSAMDDDLVYTLHVQQQDQSTYWLELQAVSVSTLIITDCLLVFVCFPGVTTHYGCIFTAR
jgi:hypothetical protein